MYVSKWSFHGLGLTGGFLPVGMKNAVWASPLPLSTWLLQGRCSLMMHFYEYLFLFPFQHCSGSELWHKESQKGAGVLAFLFISASAMLPRVTPWLV